LCAGLKVRRLGGGLSPPALSSASVRLREGILGEGVRGEREPPAFKTTLSTACVDCGG